MFIITSPPLSYSPFLLSPPLSHLPLSHISPFLTPPPLSSSRCHVDYINDTKSVLDQAPRVINALLDLAVDRGERPSYHPPCHPPCHIPCHIPSHIPCHIPYHPPCHTPCHIPCHVLSHYPLTHCPPSPPISPPPPQPHTPPPPPLDRRLCRGPWLFTPQQDDHTGTRPSPCALAHVLVR